MFLLVWGAGVMAIKVGFSTRACPEWDLETVVEQAAALGYDGFALHGLQGQTHLPSVAALQDDPGRVRGLLDRAGVELLCLQATASFESASRRRLAEGHRRLGETIELAARLGCPFVRLSLGPAAGSAQRATLAWVAQELRVAADLATRNRVTILVENGGDFVRSEDLWCVVDDVDRPAVRASWNPLLARAAGERPTNSVPRLASQLEMFVAADGRFDQHGRFLGYELPGAGNVELARAVDLLKGLCYQGWLLFEWPQATASLAEPADALPAALAFLRERLAHTYELLPAYKKDKNAPNFSAPRAVATDPVP